MSRNRNIYLAGCLLIDERMNSRVHQMRLSIRTTTAAPSTEILLCSGIKIAIIFINPKKNDQIKTLIGLLFYSLRNFFTTKGELRAAAFPLSFIRGGIRRNDETRRTECSVIKLASMSFMDGPAANKPT